MVEINPSVRGPVCRCGKPYSMREVQRTLSPITGEVVTRRLDVYLCSCGDCWAHNINNEPEAQS